MALRAHLGARALQPHCDAILSTTSRKQCTSKFFSMLSQTCVHSPKAKTVSSVSFLPGSHFSMSVLLQNTCRFHRTRSFNIRCDSSPQSQEKDNGVRVRFAPSPTGNLHVGGARTALFNWLYARSKGGKFIIRVEDTDLERSTRQSEEAMIRDLRWLGLDWDEGPEVGGDYGPYRQSERNEIYQTYAKKLLESGHVYRCFCTDEELEAMRAEQEAKKLPPKYMGKWSSASEEEIQEQLSLGKPFTYRFRVPEDKRVAINDLIRGEVAWNSDTLGDFVVLRSNGQPVYNFCVAIDDATMKISHVIRAEEHLPNTLRQVFIYEALGFKMPKFGHVSLILAPDRSKLSKRHGATSVGQFKDMGFLSEAMVNHLSLLGWNDGTEDEIFEVKELIEKFSIERITKSAAIFDRTKLEWINGQHLKKKDGDEITVLLKDRWIKSGLLNQINDEKFYEDCAELVKGGLNIISEADKALSNLFAYPLLSSLQSIESKAIVEDNIEEVSAAIIRDYEEGKLVAAIESSHEDWQKWIKGLGKEFKRKGKRLFMPVRILLTGSMQGPDVGSTLSLVLSVPNLQVIPPQQPFVPLEKRIELIKAVDWSAVKQSYSDLPTVDIPKDASVTVTSSH